VKHYLVFKSNNNKVKGSFMKTKLIFSLIGLLIASSAFAQDGFIPLAEETWVTGFDGSFSSSRRAYENSITLKNSKGFVHDDELVAREIAVSGYVGYFFIDNLATGVELSFRDINSKYTPDESTLGKVNPDTKVSEESFELDQDEFFVGPWVRYYIKVQDKDFAFYPEFSIGAMTGRYRRETQDLTRSYTKNELTGWGYNAGIGMAILLTPRYTLDLGGRYGGGQLKGEEERLPTGEVRSSDLKVTRNRFDVKVGFNVLLGQ